MNKDTSADDPEVAKIGDVDNQLFASLERAMQDANRGAYDEAIDQCHNLLKTHPSASEPYFLLGIIAYIYKDEGQAIAMCETAHKMDPDVAEYADALATIYTTIGQLSDGLYFAKLAPSLDPHPLFSMRMPPKLKDLKGAFDSAAPSTHFIEAQRLTNVGDFERALLECSAEIRINPNKIEVYILLGRVAIILRKYSRAVGAFQAALQLEPRSATASAFLARALVGLGRCEEATIAARRALALADDDAEAFLQAMDALQRSRIATLEELKSATLTFNKRFEEENGTDFDDADEPSDSPFVRIGFLSNQFFRFQHYELFDYWFALPEQKNVGYAGYQQSVHTDIVTTNIKKGCAAWREIYNLDPYTLSYTLQAEDLNVLVDLSSPNGETRQTAIALHPAKTVVGAFTLPEPGLAPGITHILSDEILEAADQAALLPGQDCIVIEGSLFAREPFMGLKPTETLPWNDKGFVTFGGVADLLHLTPECAALWSEVLHAVPNSRLLLCGSEQISEDARMTIREYFSNFGVADRVLLPISETDEPSPPADLNDGVTDEDSNSTSGDEADEQSKRLEEIVAALAPVRPKQFREIDVFLDAVPFSCPAELAQALWMGVPCVTLAGKRRPGLVGTSILTAVGRVNWAAKSADDYCKTAVGLVADAEKLESERKSLREIVSSSSLFKPEETARRIRDALETAGRRRG